MTIANGSRNIPGAIYKRAKPEPAMVMQNFDVLPADIRRAIAEATFDFDVVEIVERMRRGTTAVQVMAAIRHTDAKIRGAAKQEMRA